MFNLPLSGTGSWVEVLIVLAIAVVGLIYRYQVSGFRLRRWFAKRSGVEHRTKDLLRKYESQKREGRMSTNSADADLEARLNDALMVRGNSPGLGEAEGFEDEMYLPDIEWPSPRQGRETGYSSSV